MIRFMLDGCDISFVAEAPEDITLAQLLNNFLFSVKLINSCSLDTCIGY